jgi:flagellar hook assembly protein FlgD
VTLKIYNSVGQLVRTLVSGDYEAGTHKVIWDARNDSGVQMTSGVYLAVFKAGEVQQVRRVVLMK